MIEAAIITPLLLLLTFSIVDFGAVFYVYLALENGVSQATRSASPGKLKDDPANPGTPLDRRRIGQAGDAASRRRRPDRPRQRVHLPEPRHQAPAAPGPLASADPNDIGKVTVAYRWNLVLPAALAVFFRAAQ